MARDKAVPEGRELHNRGGKRIPALCSIVGTLMQLLVLLSCVPITAARMTGKEIYHIASGSMEPEIPVGSAVYVEAAEPGEIAAGDVIAFHSGGSVVVHRVVENRTAEGKFRTKGDANTEEDLYAVGYVDLIGRVCRYVPVLGAVLILYTSNPGKACAVCFAGCGALLNLVAGRLRE